LRSPVDKDLNVEKVEETVVVDVNPRSDPSARVGIGPRL